MRFRDFWICKDKGGACSSKRPVLPASHYTESLSIEHAMQAVRPAGKDTIVVGRDTFSILLLP